MHTLRMETQMSAPPCPVCDTPTNRAYRPNLLSPGDVEPFHWCTTCSWDSDTITTICQHTTADHYPQCGANRMESNDHQD